MNLQDRRQVIPHVAIALAVCLGGYMALVDPVRHKLAAERGAADAPAKELQQGETLQADIARMTQAMQKVTEERARIDELGRAARDERKLFASIMGLAAASNVRVDELNPAKVVAPAAPAKAANAPAGTPAPVLVAPGDTAVGYSMTAIATYEDLAKFLRALKSELGYTQVRSVRMMPVQDDKVKLIRATIETEHYAFDASPQSAAEDAMRTAAAGEH